jgi:hypothetical protein
VATAVHAQAQEADGATGEAQGNLPAESEPTSEQGDRTDQPDPARLGEILYGRALQSVFCVYPSVGGKENPATYDAGTKTKGLWLETMEYGMALPDARAV